MYADDNMPSIRGLSTWQGVILHKICRFLLFSYFREIFKAFQLFFCLYLFHVRDMLFFHA